MDGLTLIRAASALGLSVRADGDRLVVKGPKREEAVARQLLAQKAGVILALRDQWPLRWPEDSRDVFIERLGVGDDLGMDTSPGSEAWDAAVREAQRVAAGVPGGPGSRHPNLIDDVLAAFAPLGGLTVQQPQPPGPFDVPDALRDQIGYTRPAAGRAGDESPDSSGPPTPDDLKHRKLDAVITDEPDGIRWDAE